MSLLICKKQFQEEFKKDDRNIFCKKPFESFYINGLLKMFKRWNIFELCSKVSDNNEKERLFHDI